MQGSYRYNLKRIVIPSGRIRAIPLRITQIIRLSLFRFSDCVALFLEVYVLIFICFKFLYMAAEKFSYKWVSLVIRVRYKILNKLSILLF